MTDPRKNISHLKNQMNSIISDIDGVFSASWIMGIALPIILLFLDKEYRVYFMIIGALTLLLLITVGKRDLKVFYKIKELLSKTETILSTDQDIDEILNISRDIHKSLSNKKIFESYSNRYHNQQEYYEKANKMPITPKIIWIDIIEVYVAILSDLRSDLLKRIEETKIQLEQGKESIKNVEETTEVTSKHLLLQSTRLDRQIEQFEELQRVMVKV